MFGETDGLDNTINGLSFFWKSVLTGIVLGIVFAIVVDHLFPIYKMSKDFSRGLYLGSVMAFTTMMPPSASFINRHYGSADVKPVRFKINSKGTDSKRSACFAFITVDHDEQRLTVPAECCDKVAIGTIATFYVKHGALGYDIVTRFE